MRSGITYKRDQEQTVEPGTWINDGLLHNKFFLLRSFIPVFGYLVTLLSILSHDKGAKRTGFNEQGNSLVSNHYKCLIVISISAFGIHHSLWDLISLNLCKLLNVWLKWAVPAVTVALGRFQIKNMIAISGSKRITEKWWNTTPCNVNLWMSALSYIAFESVSFLLFRLTQPRPQYW